MIYANDWIPNYRDKISKDVVATRNRQKIFGFCKVNVYFVTVSIGSCLISSILTSASLVGPS